jgi:hypothetical protein
VSRDIAVQLGEALRDRYLVLGSAPVGAIIAAAKVGLWPDPNPNPIGPGMLFFFAGVLATGGLTDARGPS